MCSYETFPHGKYGRPVGGKKTGGAWDRPAGRTEAGLGRMFGSERMEERGTAQALKGEAERFGVGPSYGQGTSSTEGGYGYQQQQMPSAYGKTGYGGEGYSAGGEEEYGKTAGYGKTGYGAEGYAEQPTGKKYGTTGYGGEGYSGGEGYQGQQQQQQPGYYSSSGGAGQGSYGQEGKKPSSVHAGWNKYIGGLEQTVGKMFGSRPMQQKGAIAKMEGAMEAEAARQRKY